MPKAVFLDRDGTINAMVSHPEFGLVDSPANPDELALLPGAGEAVRRLNEAGFTTVVVSNQPGIAKGRFTPALLESMTDKMRADLALAGAHVDAVYYCLHHPKAVHEECRRRCECRKPRPGLLLVAARALRIDMAESYIVGDGFTDVQAGIAAGCRTVWIGRTRCDACQIMARKGVRPDRSAASLLEAVGLILEGVRAVQIFLDSASVQEIRRWLDEGLVDGVTTNPSIMFNDGVFDLERGAKDIAALVAPRPVSVEVTTNDHEEMLSQARAFARWADNIVVKIPVINASGVSSLRVVRTLEAEGIRVNVTACLSYNQAVLAAKVGATYVSIFGGRVTDEGNDAPRLIRSALAWIGRWGYKAQIIVGSIRRAYDVQEAAETGAHIVTVPPQFLSKVLDHRYSRETVRAFVEDGQKARAKMQAAAVPR